MKRVIALNNKVLGLGNPDAREDKYKPDLFLDKYPLIHIMICFLVDNMYLLVDDILIITNDGHTG